MFLDKNNPSINELVNWFLIRFPQLADDMKNSTHCTQTDEPNLFHIEGDVFCHTMMVCLQAENNNSNKVVKISALLHDIGKPKSRGVAPSETKKSGLKVHFRGHEGLSFYKAVEVLNALEKEGVVNTKEKQEILTIISLHGILFDSIDDEGCMKKPNKVFDKFFRVEKTRTHQLNTDVNSLLLKKETKELFKNEIELFNNYAQQVRNDSTGRFFTSKDGRKNNTHKLGKEIFTEDQFIDYIVEVARKEINKNALDINVPKITVLIGVPCSGKSTWRELNQGDAVVISRDDVLMDYAKDNKIKGSYSDIWKYLEENNLQKEIDVIVLKKFQESVQARKDMVIDQTNTSRKSRRRWLSAIPKEYIKEAVVFATEYNEIYERNEIRSKETSKSIPEEVISGMMKQFMVPTLDEVNKVNWVF